MIVNDLIMAIESDVAEPTDITDVDFTQAIKSVVFLSELNTPTGVELVAKYPYKDQRDWKQKRTELVGAGIDTSVIGEAMSLYPELVYYEANRILDEDAVEWINSVAKASQALREKDPDSYYKYIFRDDAQKSINVEAVGLLLYGLQSEHPDVNIPDLLVAAPEYVFEDDTTQLDLLVQNYDLARIMSECGLNVTELKYSELSEFIELVGQLDVDAEDFVEAASYVFYKVKYAKVEAMARSIGIRPSHLSPDLITILESMEGVDTKSYSGNRLLALYRFFGHNSEAVLGIVQNYPEYFNSKYGRKLLVKHGIIDEAQYGELKRLSSIYHAEHTDLLAASKNHANSRSRFNWAMRSEGTRQHQELMDSMRNLRNVFNDLGFGFIGQSLEEAVRENPELLDASLKQIEVRLRAFSEVMGTELARVMISYDVGFLYDKNLVGPVSDMRLADEQKAELTSAIKRHHTIVGNRESRRINDRNLLDAYIRGEHSEFAESLDGIFEQKGILTCAEEAIIAYPRVLHANLQLIKDRMEALVAVLGPNRASVVLRKNLSKLSQPHFAKNLAEDLTPEEAELLSQTVIKIGQPRYRAKSRANKSSAA